MGISSSKKHKLNYTKWENINRPIMRNDYTNDNEQYFDVVPLLFSSVRAYTVPRTRFVCIMQKACVVHDN